MVAINGGADAAVLTLADGRTIDTILTVLSTVTPEPDWFPDLDGAPGYLNLPWPSSRLRDNIDPDQSDIILGTSLSNTDTMMTLLDERHRGFDLAAGRAPRRGGAEPAYSTDNWNGYPAARQCLADIIAEWDLRILVIASDDMHQRLVRYLLADPNDPRSPAIAIRLIVQVGGWTNLFRSSSIEATVRRRRHRCDVTRFDYPS